MEGCFLIEANWIPAGYSLFRLSNFSYIQGLLSGQLLLRIRGMPELPDLSPFVDRLAELDSLLA